MALDGVVSTELFSTEAVNDLVVTPLFRTSVALAALRTVPVRGTSVWLPTVSSGTASWYSDLDEIAESGAAAAEVEITPRKVAALRTVSNESAADASAASILGQALVSELAMAVDKGAFTGSGPKGPLGFPGIVGPSTVVGAPDDLDVFIDAIAAVEAAGGQAGAIFLNPSTWAALSKIKSTAGGSLPVLSPSVAGAVTRSLYGVPVHVSQFVDAAVAWVVDVERTAAFVRMPFNVAVDTSSAFTRDGVQVRATGRVEIASMYPLTVCRIGV